MNKTILNKSCISFIPKKELGGAVQILSMLSYYNVISVQIQSTFNKKINRYKFKVDLLYNDKELYEKSIKSIRPFTTNLTILGEYYEGQNTKEL